MTVLRDHLQARVEAGAKLLVPYVMAGFPDPASFAAVAAAASEAGDAIEIGLPYSDPLVDGPVIAAAAEQALAAGVTPLRGLELGAPPPGAAPRAVMTYYNPIYRCGEEEFCRRVAAAGYAGLIVPDIPHEEAGGLRAAAAGHGLAWIGLVAPTTSPERVAAVCEGATGFVYAVSSLGVTGERSEVAPTAARVVAACRAATDLPVLVGFGVSRPEHAVEAAAEADGVIVGSAVVRVAGERGAPAVAGLLSEIRAALERLAAGAGASRTNRRRR